LSGFFVAAHGGGVRVTSRGHYERYGTKLEDHQSPSHFAGKNSENAG
jgi:hypothetical protein